MGVEDVRVTLRAKLPPDAAAERLRSLASVKHDEPPGQGSPRGRLVYESGTLRAEAEVRRKEPGSRITLRFAVCHPPSSDGEFVDFAVAAAKAVDAASISIAEDLPPGVQGDFSSWTPAFRETLANAVADKRALWQADFGSAEAVVFPDEAVRRFIIGENEPGR
jgi:hypothetical protein